MSKVNVLEVKADDFLEFETKTIPGWAQSGKYSGMVQRVIKQMIGGNEYRYIELLANTGLQGAYLALTDEVTKLAVSDEERAEIKRYNSIARLPRVVDMQGSDPEIFIVDKDNVVIPSFLFLGSKEKPTPIPGMSREGVFWDGFQAEFNIPGVSCLDATVSHIRYGLRALNKAAKVHDPNARLTIIPTMDIPPHMLRDNKEEHVQFGCMPSLNVYGMAGIKADGRDVPFRSAGGHIHLQLNSTQKKRIPEYVKALDAILGVACVSMFGNFDDPRRREYYGLAGEYRTPPHGLEYRPLSNVWMCHPTSTYIIFELARKIISLVDKDLFKHWNASEADIIECINTCNIPLACAMIQENERMFRSLLASLCYQKEENVNVVFNTFMLGVEQLVDKVDDVEGNWQLGQEYLINRPRIVDMKLYNKNFAKLAIKE